MVTGFVIAGIFVLIAVSIVQTRVLVKMLNGMSTLEAVATALEKAANSFTRILNPNSKASNNDQDKHEVTS